MVDDWWGTILPIPSVCFEVLARRVRFCDRVIMSMSDACTATRNSTRVGVLVNISVGSKNISTDSRGHR